FREDYLTLPPDVLATAMAKHLKAFSVRDAQGRLLPKFLVVLEGKPTNLLVVMANYERILEARFTDAQFFWREDVKTSLADKAASLAGVAFHKSLGTVAEKSARLESVVRTLACGDREALVRAIGLAKADLVTQMVKEFPTLQGVMGSEYAKHDDEPTEVVQALREQYAPRTAKDPIPASDTGLWLSLLDRVDTLTGFFGIGLAPTSSEDPYGLRRQALGLVRILVEKPLSLSLDTLIHSALESWRDHSKLTVADTTLQSQLRAFLLDRVRWWAIESRGYPREIVEAVLAGPTGDLADVRRRLDTLQAFWQDARQREQILFAAGKVVERTGRIVASVKNDDAGVGQPDPSKFAAPEERALWEAWGPVKAETTRWLQQGDYAKATESYGTLYPPLSRFFDNVFIMDENLDVRRNRLALMREIYTVYANAVGDLCQLPLPKDL
ncbi:MAG: glycine--tRNA ligase subunit beta, partial [Candidatus Omnitrophica bacterium]|nr:glycine--tRNA ligase subunit beta [Candidatus Omnitrophota bacterium]